MLLKEHHTINNGKLDTNRSIDKNIENKKCSKFKTYIKISKRKTKIKKTKNSLPSLLLKM